MWVLQLVLVLELRLMLRLVLVLVLVVWKVILLHCGRTFALLASAQEHFVSALRKARPCRNAVESDWSLLLCGAQSSHDREGIRTVEEGAIAGGRGRDCCWAPGRRSFPTSLEGATR